MLVRSMLGVNAPSAFPTSPPAPGRFQPQSAPAGAPPIARADEERVSPGHGRAARWTALARVASRAVRARTRTHTGERCRRPSKKNGFALLCCTVSIVKVSGRTNMQPSKWILHTIIEAIHAGFGAISPAAAELLKRAALSILLSFARPFVIVGCALFCCTVSIPQAFETVKHAAIKVNFAIQNCIYNAFAAISVAAAQFAKARGRVDVFMSFVRPFVIVGFALFCCTVSISQGFETVKDAAIKVNLASEHCTYV